MTTQGRNKTSVTIQPLTNGSLTQASRNPRLLRELQQDSGVQDSESSEIVDFQQMGLILKGNQSRAINEINKGQAWYNEEG
jgi:NAD(P)H-dependent FMN reductase